MTSSFSPAFFFSLVTNFSLDEARFSVRYDSWFAALLCTQRVQRALPLR